MKELFHVLKDHKNPMIQELVNDSYEKCFQREMESLFGDFEFDGDWGTENVVRCCFVNKLHFNQKRHKDKVPRLIGKANGGKTSVFQPVLGLIHHSNIATVTKQRAFNKALINKTTEVIFIDEASISTMEIDDWKIFVQGGYTAADVKYQRAKSFINRCPMLLTAQQKLQFKPEDQPAMDRRLRHYTFKSLPEPKKKAADWQRKNPMHCVAWTAEKAPDK